MPDEMDPRIDRARRRLTNRPARRSEIQRLVRQSGLSEDDVIALLAQEILPPDTGTGITATAPPETAEPAIETPDLPTPDPLQEAIREAIQSLLKVSQLLNGRGPSNRR